MLKMWKLLYNTYRDVIFCRLFSLFWRRPKQLDPMENLTFIHTVPDEEERRKIMLFNMEFLLSPGKEALARISRKVESRITQITNL